MSKYEIYFVCLLQMNGSQPPEKFWVKNPCTLFSSGSIFPTQNKTVNENLNSLTRLVLIIAVIIAAFGNKHWGVFLAAAILLIVLLKYGGGRTVAEHFTRTPTYVSDDFHQTVVPPLYAEEWQIPPPAYDIYDSAAPNDIEYFPEPLKPQSYPYGQYRTITSNLTTPDSYVIDQTCGGSAPAREYANSYWTRNSIAFRDNMTRVFKKSLARRFRQNCNDTFSPYSSY